MALVLPLLSRTRPRQAPKPPLRNQK